MISAAYNHSVQKPDVSDVIEQGVRINHINTMTAHAANRNRTPSSFAKSLEEQPRAKKDTVNPVTEEVMENGLSSVFDVAIGATFGIPGAGAVFGNAMKGVGFVSDFREDRLKADNRKQPKPVMAMPDPRLTWTHPTPMLGAAA